MQRVYPPSSGLEAVVCVLAGDAHRHHVALRGALRLAVYVKVLVALRVPVEWAGRRAGAGLAATGVLVLLLAVYDIVT